MKKKTVGAFVATAVAGLLLANASIANETTSAPTQGTVKCQGGNECKGKGSCHGDGNGCAGKNSCKGKGWVMTQTDKECTDKHGTVSH